MKLRFRTKLSYGIGGLADNALFTLIETFLLFYLTTVVGIRPAAAGAILAVGSLWEAFCGPIFGFLSDHTESRFGRRKPFLLTAAVPVMIVTTLLFTRIALPYTISVLYYGLLTVLFWGCFAVFFVPYMAWGAELTEDYNERTVLRSYAYVFNQVGRGLGTVAPPILVAALMGLGLSLGVSWSAVGAMVGIASGGALLYCALTIRHTDVPGFRRDPNREPLLDLRKIGAMFRSYLVIIKLRPVQFLVASSLLYLIGNTIFMSDMVYFFTYDLQLNAAEIAAATLIITVSGIVFTPFVAKLAERTDKKTAFIGGLVLSGCALIAARFVQMHTVWGACVSCTLFSVGNTCYWQLMPSMLYDVCEAEELASGEKHAGEVISLQALSESVSAAVGVQLLGIILQQAGFQESLAVQSATALTWVSHCYTLLPGIFTLLVAVLLWRYPIDRHTYPRILAGVEKRRRGEPVDLQEYRDIFGGRK